MTGMLGKEKKTKQQKLLEKHLLCLHTGYE